jgi:hypothetical protein
MLEHYLIATINFSPVNNLLINVDNFAAEVQRNNEKV